MQSINQAHNRYDSNSLFYRCRLYILLNIVTGYAVIFVEKLVFSVNLLVLSIIGICSISILVALRDTYFKATFKNNKIFRLGSIGIYFSISVVPVLMRAFSTQELLHFISWLIFATALVIDIVFYNVYFTQKYFVKLGWSTTDDNLSNLVEDKSGGKISNMIAWFLLGILILLALTLLYANVYKYT